MQPAPQGLVAVKSVPRGAGTPGQRSIFDWDEIIPWLEANPWQPYLLPFPMPFNAVARWRKRFPQVRFDTLGRHYVRVQTTVNGRKKLVNQLWCSLFVTWTGEDNADQATDMGD
jgi:hypothetical protein